jgi:uncharacterized protein (TIGR02246 family)
MNKKKSLVARSVVDTKVRLHALRCILCKANKAFRLVTALAAIGLIGCAKPAHNSAASAETDALVRRMFEAFNRHDLEALSALYSVDAVVISPDHAAVRGPGGVRRVYAALFTQFPDIKDHVSNIVVDGDRVAVEFVSKGCVAANQDCFELPIAAFITVRNGLIVRDVGYFDVLPESPND